MAALCYNFSLEQHRLEADAARYWDGTAQHVESYLNHAQQVGAELEHQLQFYDLPAPQWAYCNETLNASTLFDPQQQAAFVNAVLCLDTHQRVVFSMCGEAAELSANLFVGAYLHLPCLAVAVRECGQSEQSTCGVSLAAGCHQLNLGSHMEATVSVHISCQP
mmetsp:Transcript_35196/g.106146  ORF Transcript_35196/g.106146 Transcript_35196/m.106146 type:complete len:163 (+) Transcript_35196:48-536(+)